MYLGREIPESSRDQQSSRVHPGLPDDDILQEAAPRPFPPESQDLHDRKTGKQTKTIITVIRQKVYSAASTRIHAQNHGKGGRGGEGPGAASQPLNRLIRPLDVVTKWCSLYLLPVKSPEIVYALELILIQSVVVLGQNSHAAIFLHQNA